MPAIPSLPERIYGFLAEDEDARVCKDIPADACDEQPRSFVLQLAALTLTRLGDTIMSPRLVLAWMLATLGAPAMFVAFLVPLRESFALLPQLLVAQRLREYPRRKYFWVAGALGQAAALGGMTAAALFLEGAALGWSVVLALSVFSLARGVCSVAAKDVLGKTVSRTRRGRLTGNAAAAAGAATLLVAMGLILFPEMDGSRGVFALLLAGAMLLWILAALLYARVPESAGATQGGGNAFREALRSLGLLVHDRRFAAFVGARALLVATAFAIPYLVVLVQRASESAAAVPESTTLGAMLFASGLAALLGGAAWGKFADRAANRTMAAGALLSVLAMAAALLLHALRPDWLRTETAAALLLFAATVAHHGVRIGRQTYLVDMATGETRAQYVAVSNTVMGFVLLSGLSLGVLDHAAGVVAVLLLLAGVGMAAAACCWRLPDVSG
ncbi:MAG TPA: MFS transporter permease [Gammaproteobacteria bacterium]